MKKGTTHIEITRVVNLSELSRELGYTYNFLKRNGIGPCNYFPEWIKPQIEKLNLLMSEWLEETKEVRQNKKFKNIKNGRVRKTI